MFRNVLSVSSLTLASENPETTETLRKVSYLSDFESNKKDFFNIKKILISSKFQFVIIETFPLQMSKDRKARRVYMVKQCHILSY